jgi:DTW domain-containing protein YfiP
MIDISTPLTIVRHYREAFLSSNTAYLALLTLSDARVIDHGKRDCDLEGVEIPKTGRHALYLFPEAEARPLNRELIEEIAGPIELVVPDGTWRQARKIKANLHGQEKFTTVSLTTSAPSRYLLRKQGREHGLCTYEAIAHAMAVLESADVRDQMLAQLDLMVARVMRSRTGGALS